MSWFKCHGRTLEERVTQLEHEAEQRHYPLLRKYGLTAFKKKTFYDHCYSVHAYEVQAVLEELEKRLNLKLPVEEPPKDGL